MIRSAQGMQPIGLGEYNAPNPFKPVVAYDYANQAWIKNGVYVRCGHPDSMDCRCFGKHHAGEAMRSDAVLH